MESSRDQDRADVQRVLDGDVDAFEAIVRRWQGPLVSLAYRFCRHQGRAEEMAQEAFVRAYRSLRQWRGDSAFSTWLFALALNVYRSELRRLRPTEVPIEDFRLAAQHAGVVESIAERERDETVRRTVGTLPQKYRDAVVAYYFWEMDVARAAQCLHVSDGTLKSRLHRARSLLKSRLSRIIGSRTVEET